jgi:hypothetical protein
MEKFIIGIMLTCLITSANAQEQIKIFPSKNSVSFSLLGFANNSFFINYERWLGGKSGIMLIGGIYYHNKNYTNIGFLGELQYRYYFESKSFKENVWNRVFFAPYFFDRQYQINNYKYYSFLYHSDIANDFSINSFGGGAVMGYKLSGKKFLFEVFLGGGIKLCSDNLDSDIGPFAFRNNFFDPAYKGIEPKLGFNIGFCF